MPKDIQDTIKHLCNEVVLRILQLADEDMLRDSGNTVYLRMKRELDEVRIGSATLEHKINTHVSEKHSVPIHMASILSVRFMRDGKRLVYHAQNPPNGPNLFKELPNSPEDADKTLVDVCPDTVPSHS